MTTILRPILATLAACACASAIADDASDCRAAAGTFLTGTVASTPRFAHGKSKNGVELSHTLMDLVADSDKKHYQIAVDNVFASGYRLGQEVVPPPLDAIKVGDRLELCGASFSGGLHWVHTNCGDRPTTDDPNGWVKVIGAGGSVGPNLEDGQTYCRLWPRR